MQISDVLIGILQEWNVQFELPGMGRHFSQRVLNIGVDGHEPNPTFPILLGHRGDALGVLLGQGTLGSKEHDDGSFSPTSSDDFHSRLGSQ